jgi:hypothetical protein
VAGLRLAGPALQTIILVISDQVGSPDATKQLGSLTGNRNGSLLTGVRLAKADLIKTSGGPMSGIYMILVFLAVMAALNKFEFGRFD